VSTPQSATLADDLVGFIATDVALGAGDLDADTDLVMTGLIDSLGVIMVVEWLERRLAIVVDPNDVVIEHFASVTAIIDYLRGRDDCQVE
jgi:acyl carrier protein